MTVPEGYRVTVQSQKRRRYHLASDTHREVTSWGYVLHMPDGQFWVSPYRYRSEQGARTAGERDAEQSWLYDTVSALCQVIEDGGQL